MSLCVFYYPSVCQHNRMSIKCTELLGCLHLPAYPSEVELKDCGCEL